MNVRNIEAILIIVAIIIYYINVNTIVHTNVQRDFNCLTYSKAVAWALIISKDKEEFKSIISKIPNNLYVTENISDIIPNPCASYTILYLGNEGKLKPVIIYVGFKP